MKTVWRRQGGGLFPTDEEALEVLTAHKDGCDVMVEVKGARNPRQHNLFFALAKIVADNEEKFQGNVHWARKDILRCLGYVDYEVDHTGTAHVSVKSIAFHSMTQAEFNAMFQSAIHLVCDWIGTKPKDLQDEVNRMVADNRYESYRR